LTKEPIYVLTCVERSTRAILSWGVVYERDWDSLQSLVNTAPSARCYFSDGFATYAQVCHLRPVDVPWKLMYPGKYQAMPDKSQTYSVEADNAELRHYLARLARKSRCFSRCLFSRCLWALQRAVALFVHAWNQRHYFRRRYPKSRANVYDFIADLC